MRIDWSLLLLATPLMPPMVPALGAPNGVADPRPPMPCGVLDALLAGVEGDDPRPSGAVCPPRPGWLSRPDVPAPAAAPTGNGTKSSFVIGSLYFFRRYRSRTSTSMFGGYALAVLRWNSAIAWTYCIPRKTS